MATIATDLRSLAALVRAVVARRETPEPGSWSAAFERILEHPLPEDEALLELARAANLSSFELLSIALAAGADADPVLAEQIARLQMPHGRGRPLAGFLAVAFADVLGERPRLIDLAGGRGAALGLLEFSPANVALPERATSVPAHICGALAGIDILPPQASVAFQDIPLAASAEKDARKYGAALRDGSLPSLVIRGTGGEPEAAALRIANGLRRRPVLLEKGEIAALGPWLTARRFVPIHRLDLAPGESADLPAIPGYQGPRLVAATPQGAIQISGSPALEWRIGLPGHEERHALWRIALPGADSFTDTVARTRRYGASRIHHLGGLTRQLTAIEKQPACEDLLYRASWIVERRALGHLALPVEDPGIDLPLLVPPRLAETIEQLLMRCRRRDQLAASLGPSVQCRYRPGVRALFSGSPGTGKSLAAAWLASRLRLPLFRVDLATVVSKYIGETEKNLARLFDQAESSEVVLLFDEADALFSRRTGVNDANDRFANAQTNYLLERMESFGGIAVLTTNHDANLDSAFQRRLDFLVEFTSPGPHERRDLWLSHLGADHTLDGTQINRLAAALDWSGGHIRNAVLHAAALGDGCLGWHEVLKGVRLEARKLRSSLPMELLE